MSLTLKIEGMEKLQTALATAQGELARAGRNMLNDTARSVRDDIRKGLEPKFAIVRRSTIMNSVRIEKADFATKERLQVRISLMGPKGQGSTLTKFEKAVNPAGTKTARDGGRLPVPARAIRKPGGGGHVQRGMSLRSFMPLVTVGGQRTKLRQSKGRLVPSKTVTSKQQLVGRKGAFMVVLRKTGTPALVRARKGSDGIQVLWTFERAPVKIPTRLDFGPDAIASANRHLPKHARDAVTHALRRAGL